GVGEPEEAERDRDELGPAKGARDEVACMGQRTEKVDRRLRLALVVPDAADQVRRRLELGERLERAYDDAGALGRHAGGLARGGGGGGEVDLRVGHRSDRSIGGATRHGRRGTTSGDGFGPSTERAGARSARIRAW